MSARQRVLVADDHEQSRQAIVKLLRAEFDVVAAVDDGRKLVDAVVSLLPDAIVSDVSMPLLTGIQAMQELSRKGYEIPFVLVSTANFEAEDHIKVGAMAFVNKVDMGRDLVTAVFSVLLGQASELRETEDKLQYSEVP